MRVRAREFLHAIVEDLRAAAALLIEPGLAPKLAVGRARAGPGPGSMAGLLDDVETLIGLVPRLLHELEHSGPSAELVFESSPIPRRATASRWPSDYVTARDRVLPRIWLEAVPVLQPDPRPLSWVLHLLEVLQSRVAQAEERMGAVLREALLDRHVDSTFARAEEAELRAAEDSIGQAQAGLRRAREAILHKASWRLTPSSWRPRPYPMSPAWQSLRALAELMGDSHAAVVRQIETSLRSPIHVADEAFLYQRWVGLKLVRALESFG
ncbi:MAG: hypothetical protein AB1726_15935 [Planctomycetota bacterium]